MLPMLLFAACVSYPGAVHRPTSDELEAVDATIDAWAMLRGPLGPVCRAQRSRLRILLADDSDAIERACGRDDVSGCMRHADGLQIRRERLTPLIVVRPRDDRHRLRIIVHEATHWLATCEDGVPDRHHTRPELWGPGGVQRRAKARVAP